MESVLGSPAGVLWLEPQKKYYLADPEDRQQVLALRQMQDKVQTHKTGSMALNARMLSSVTDGDASDTLVEELGVMRRATDDGSKLGTRFDELELIGLDSGPESEEEGHGTAHDEEGQLEQDTCTPRVKRRGSSNLSLSQSLQKASAVASFCCRPSAWRAKAESARRDRASRKRAERRERARAVRDRYLDEVRRMHDAARQRDREAAAMARDSPASFVTDENVEGDGRTPWEWARKERALARVRGVAALQLGGVRRDLGAEFDAALENEAEGDSQEIVFVVDRGVSPLETPRIRQRSHSWIWFSTDSTPSTVEDLFTDADEAVFQVCECVPQGRRVLRPRVLALMHVFDRECLCCVCNKPLPFEVGL
ncbi:hypothetical protein FVE85_7262 [Porphyridium purpureum]|uniref:Uncharacterized protein n=1 Tax=Porphyridium purpureum TaxID=35688 RepID=A0A5J4ZAK4_PORPP|nr:hypothetical protein FVE85_7262 [Porphyridium purpureum]|eukprot:POR2112..scf295_1